MRGHALAASGEVEAIDRRGERPYGYRAKPLRREPYPIGPEGTATRIEKLKDSASQSRDLCSYGDQRETALKQMQMGY